MKTWTSPNQKITIYNADCIDVMKTLPAESLDSVVTSPPYNQLSKMPKNPGGMYAKNKWMKKVRDVGYQDDLSEADYEEWQINVAKEVRRLLKPGAAYIYNHKCRWRGDLIHPIDLVRKFPGYKLRQEIIWDRRSAVAFSAGICAPSDERIYWLYRDDAKYIFNQEACRYMSIWFVRAQYGVPGHPCPYPIELAQRMIQIATPNGGTVLDPFCGSGSSAIAALTLNKNLKFIGIEKEERFFDLAVERIQRSIDDDIFLE